MLGNLSRRKEDCPRCYEQDLFFVLLEKALLFHFLYCLYLLPGCHRHLLLYGGADLPESGQELLLVVGRHPELLCGKGDGGHLHARQLPYLPLHFGCTVGTAKSFKNVDLLLYAGRYAVKFPARVVHLLVGMMAVVMLVPAGFMVVTMLMATAAGFMVVLMGVF